jgi:molecular chaperone DnaK
MGKIIGIDLGTTNSVVAVMLGSEPVVIPSAEGERLVPSVVAVNKNGERLVGRTARNQAFVNPCQTIFSVKRFMGRAYEDKIVQEMLNRIPYQVSAAENGDVRVTLADKQLAPPEISAMILAKIKMDAESYIGETVKQAVITVPAYFNDAQRKATKDAGKIAGLEVLRIINEPTASSLAYGLNVKNNQTILVYDLGGGTFDVSILKVGDGVFEVKATCGDTFLGGDDFDQRVMEYLNDEFEHNNKFSLRDNQQAVQRLKGAAEHARIELSSLLQTDISLPYISSDSTGPKHLALTLTRARLEQLTADLVERTLAPIQQALKDVDLTPAEIDAVVLVGGMTRMPAIQEAVRRVFGKEPYKGVNPDEVVAIGAAIQAGVLAGEVKDVLLLDVIPLTLSIETMGGISTGLIERNTTIPTRKSEIFSTAIDNQPQVEIHVVQGERPMAVDNKTLGRFVLDGLPPAPRGIPQIEVTFDIDANGILKVTARDLQTGRSQHITLTASSGLSEAELDQMRKDAEFYADHDRMALALVEARNYAENSLYNADGFLKAFGEKVPEQSQLEIVWAVSELKNVIDAQDLDILKANTKALDQMLHRISSSLNESASYPGSAHYNPDIKTGPFNGINS